MYITNIQNKPAGRLSGPMVVSMRRCAHDQVPKAVLSTGRFPAVHGSPVHIGDPAAIGIKDVNKPDFGDAVEIREGETPVFWACGVTPQAGRHERKAAFCDNARSGVHVHRRPEGCGLRGLLRRTGNQNYRRSR